MAEHNKSSELSDWIKNHVARYLATHQEDDEGGTRRVQEE
jgi:hypothetical protein